MRVLRRIFKELWFHRGYTGLFLLCLAMGLSGLALLDIFQRSFSSQLKERSRTFAGADLVIQGRQSLTEENRRKVLLEVSRSAGAYEIAEVQELFSMVAHGADSRLVQVRAFSEGYPFYGALGRQRQGPFRGADPSAIHKRPVVWVYPELLSQLGLKIGQSLKIGGYEFEVEDVVTDDASAPIGRGALAPRVYMSLLQLEKTGLVQKGSTVYYNYLFRLGSGVDLKLLAKDLNRVIEDPALNASDHEGASEISGRLFTYLGDYLGLVSIVALVLSCVGAVFLFQSYIHRRLREMAVLRILGMGVREVQFHYGLQTVILGFSAGVVALALGGAFLPALEASLARWLPFTLEFRFTLNTAVMILGTGAVSGFLVAFPTLLQLRRVPPQLLFQENASPSLVRGRRDLYAWIPAILALYVFSFVQSKSFQVSGLFVILLLVSSAALAGLGALVLRVLERRAKDFESAWKQGFLLLARQKAPSLLTLLAVSFGVLLLFLVGSVERTLQSEFSFENEGRLPSFFLFDIQPEQLEPLAARLRQDGFELQNLSPLVRARLEKVNGKPFERSTGGEAQTREEETAQRFRNRGLNISERNELSAAEAIYEGRAFSGPYNPAQNEPAEVSVEYRYAERLGLSLGDEMEFDIQGVPVRAKIVNFRRVKWAAFQPNFFVQFQAGVLSEAPRTYLASLSQVPETQKSVLQGALAREFSNVSLIDVSRTVEKILSLSKQMGWALRLMALLVLATGLVVLAAVLEFRVRTQVREMNLYRILGVTPSRLRRILGGPQLVWTLVAGALAVAVGSAITQLVTRLLFEQWASLSWATALGAIAISLVVGWISVVLLSRRLSRTKPSDLFGR